MWSLYLLWLIETGECIHSSARSSANTHYFQHSLVYVCITILLPFRDDTDVIDKDVYSGPVTASARSNAKFSLCIS